MKLLYIISIALIAFFAQILNAEQHEETLKKINERKELINSASEKFGINSLYLSAIIYTERTKNYDWTDEVFDELIARAGQNSSMGFCQVKIKTAYFIEKQLNDPVSNFYCGKEYEGILTISANPFVLIEKLNNDSLNILYAAAYLKIIENYWGKRGFSIKEKPEILGSLYQLGLFHPSGKVREPHFNPQPNEFGVMVKESVGLFSNLKENNERFLLFN